MSSLKLTVFIEDRTDLDMEVHVVAPEHAAASADVTPLRPRVVTSPRDDEYALGGYAGI